MDACKFIQTITSKYKSVGKVIQAMAKGKGHTLGLQQSYITATEPRETRE